MCGMAEQQGETTRRIPWLVILGVLLLVWAGGAIAAGDPAPIAWLVALVGIALLMVGLLRR